MCKILTCVLACFAINAGIALSAQISTRWTLDACMRYAVEHSPQTAIQYAQLEIAKESYKNAIAKLLPSLNASTSANFNFGRSVDPETNIYMDINSFNNSYGISSSLTLFDGFTSINNVRMQYASREMSKYQTQYQRDMVAYATMEAFLKVQYYNEMVDLVKQQLNTSMYNLHQTERMLELGLKGVPDLAEMQAKESSDRYQLVRQQNLLAIAAIRLKEQMNFPVDELLEIESYIMPEDTIFTVLTTDELYEQALRTLPQVQAIKRTLDMEKFSYAATRGAIYPELTVSGGWNTGFSRRIGELYDVFKEQFKNRRGFYISVNLNIPIFDGFYRLGNVRYSKQQFFIAQKTHDADLRILYKNIDEAVTDLNGQIELCTLAQRQSNAAELAHRVNERKYYEGLISTLELHTSANRMLEAQMTVANEQLTYFLKYKMVAYYRGEPFIND